MLHRVGSSLSVSIHMPKLLQQCMLYVHVMDKDETKA